MIRLKILQTCTFNIAVKVNKNIKINKKIINSNFYAYKY